MKVIYTIIVAIFVMFIITFSLENTAPSTSAILVLISSRDPSQRTC